LNKNAREKEVVKLHDSAQFSKPVSYAVWVLKLATTVDKEQTKINYEKLPDVDKEEIGAMAKQLIDAQGILIVCNACFSSPRMCMRDCIIGCGSTSSPIGKGKAANVSNIQTHYKYAKNKSCPHHMELHEAMEKYDHQKQSDMVSISSSTKVSPSSQTSKRYNGGATLDSIFVKSEQEGNNDQMNLLKSELARHQLHARLFRFMNDENIAPNVLKSPHLNELIRFTIDNAKYLRYLSNKRLKLSIHRYNSFQGDAYAEMIDTIVALTSKIRNWYITKVGRPIRFIHVSHDIWDGKWRVILGISIFFMDPESGRFYMIPVRLVSSF